MGNKFSEKALRQLGDCYVYALIDPRTNKVFYIGKGSGNRVFNHEIESGKSPDSEKLKLQTINDIEANGGKVKRIILNWGLTESQAFAAEAALINLLNYTSNIKLSNIQSGHDIHEALSVEDFEIRYGAEKLKEEDIKHGILIIKINKLFKWDMSPKDLYDATRGIWVASLNRVRHDVEYVFAVYNQLIVAVYKPDEWYRVGENRDDIPRKHEFENGIDDKTKKRIYFVSKNYGQSEESLDENQKFYRHKSIAGFAINQSAQNPITYLSSSIEKTKKIKIIRSALTLLANENKIIYEPETFPKSDEWIKFQTTELNSLFKFSGFTKWDGEQFPSISYLEYHLSSNSIVITYKIMKKSIDKVNVMEKYKKELSLLDKETGSYWHLKRYKIDYNIVYESEDKIDAMKKQIESILLEIKEDLNKIAQKIG